MVVSGHANQSGEKEKSDLLDFWVEHCLTLLMRRCLNKCKLGK